MDEEDIGEHIAGTTITASAQYDSLGKAEKEALLRQQLGEGVLGGEAPEELVVAAKGTAGYMLMRAMGWKEGTSTVQ